MLFSNFHLKDARSYSPSKASLESRSLIASWLMIKEGVPLNEDGDAV